MNTEIDILDKIKNREVTDTYFYNPNWRPDENSDISGRQQSSENIKRFSLYCDIMDAISKGHISGEKSLDGEHTNYQKLVLTEKGKNYYRLMRTPINDLVKPSWFEVIAKNIVGRVVAVAVVPIFIYIFNQSFPEVIPNIWHYIERVIGDNG